MTTDLKAEPFNAPENITVGLARVIFAPVVAGMSAYHLPGCKVTFDRYEAHAYAVRMNELMWPGDLALEVA